MAKKYLCLGISSWIMIYSSWAGEVVQKTCRSSLVNLLHQHESKSSESLDMLEFYHHVDTRKVFDTENLKISPVPLMREIFGIYRRPLVARGARSLFNDVKLVGNLEGQNLVSLLRPNIFYTYVVDEEKIVFAQTRPGRMRDYGSKHAILRDQFKELHLAGEFYVDEKGIFHFDGASGTFQTPNAVTQKGLTFFRDELGITNAQVHLFTPPGPTHQIKKEIPPRGTSQQVQVLTSVVGRELASLGGKMMILEGDTGSKRVKYEFKLAGSHVTREFIYDTNELDLHKKNSQLRSSSALLDETKEAPQAARSRINSTSPFYVQAYEDISIKDYESRTPRGKVWIRLEERSQSGVPNGPLHGHKISDSKTILLGDAHGVEEVKALLIRGK